MTNLDRDATQHDSVAETLARVADADSRGVCPRHRDITALLGFARDVLGLAAASDQHPSYVLRGFVAAADIRDAAARHLGGGK